MNALVLPASYSGHNYYCLGYPKKSSAVGSPSLPVQSKWEPMRRKAHHFIITLQRG